MSSSVVQGYLFHSVDSHVRNDTICQILRRADVSDIEAREMGPSFTVQFGDGEIVTVYGSELEPWFPV